MMDLECSKCPLNKLTMLCYSAQSSNYSIEDTIKRIEEELGRL